MNSFFLLKEFFYVFRPRMTLNLEAARSAATSGPPKIRKNASKKNKKSWRKNVDMTEVEAAIGKC